MFSRGFKLFELSVVLVSALLLSSAYAFSTEIPQFDTYVNDYAHTLPDNYRHQLNERLHNFEVTTLGHPQVVVVIVPNTGDESIEEFANKTFHKNKLGHSDNNNGVLTVISMDHKMRIEVGYDLEPTLTDSKSHDILEIMKPSLKAGNLPKAFDDEMGQLLPIVSAGSSENAKPVGSNVSQATNSQQSPTSKGFSFVSFIIVMLLIGFGIFLYRKYKFAKTNTKYSDNTLIDKPTLTNTYISPLSPDYSRSQPRYNPARSTVYNRPGPFSPPEPTPYTPPKDHSVLKSAAAGAVGGFVASELLNSGSRRRDDDNSYSSSPSSDSYSSSSDSSSSSSDSSYDSGNSSGDSGGGGSSDSW